MLDPQVRWQQRFSNLETAWERLLAACTQNSYSELELAGLIQMFEFTFELAWKTLKDFLSYEGYEVNSPRDAIRKGFASHLINDPELWLAALESRNRLSHTYDKRAATEAEHLIKQTYAPMLATLVEELSRRRKQT